MNVNQNELTRAAYELCLMVETLPASELQTKVSIQASALLRLIGEKTPGP